MLKQLTLDQRGRVAEKVMDWGNLVFIGLVIVQVVPGGEVNLRTALFGVVALVGAYFGANRIMIRGGGRK
ncbi:hypothetical protein A2630_03425 [Candidatus Woesebacteria bacterium RIFCSPHIGHO2_01_FULL_44_10]|uniref:Uncharacterized protein n=1 Tax=Candidatus Woesebacteria bacterium RIFCSPLOWO2_01_FULL_44_14 TaxID=1802525 RepID=A0A1F8BZH3_9BACT|nr:MAG: hypothetical protein A2630_03425 [Candidatus Woesebacteria bacterium RIFCSPHIGHO2_01_FULL_44_10]OGM55940.1 MAG: hypothetical protein A3F62_05150 [Candidatus Woesebacteria bacterium RIFCSPHIGHO2_12_FULL_44_11]OGM69493.1 MAG: hypothetical protein A2975_02965 [Candidatus Woesebacteria bacterium RIFCSPLOWO2_01_FULL_44_14]